MEPRIETSPGKKLAGRRVTMSWADNKISELWGSFMPLRKNITNAVSTDLISMQIYSPAHFTDFKPTNLFEKWAAVEVSDFHNVPAALETFTLPPGLYAVFDYKGSSSDPGVFQYIFGTWLPSSSYMLANRPHFEILGEKYKNNDPASEEEIWIPVSLKA